MAEFTWNHSQKYVARTTDVLLTLSADGAKGVRVILDVTALTATQSVTAHIQTRDPATGKWVTILSSAAVAAVTPAQTTPVDGQPTTLVVYPGAPVVANASSGLHIGDDIRVAVTASIAGARTFSLGIQFLH